MPESRLQRSYDASLRTRDDVAAFCENNGIPYSVDFDAVTPNDELRRQFEEAYAMKAFPPTDLPEKGGSTIAVFETRVGTKLHGEMVAAVGNHVGNNLERGVETIYVQAALNPHYREAYEKHLVKPVNELIENQGVAVIHTSIGWPDRKLSFNGGLDEQANDLWKITAFVVDAASNEGKNWRDPITGTYGYQQKHNAVSHAPPLVVHVGAAAKDANREWNVEGYSSANSPTFLAPVAPDKKAQWDRYGEPEGLTGTSISSYASGVLAALNRRYGPYLTREQILYAVMATCNKVGHVSEFQPQTPQRQSLDYTRNAAGLEYNPEYAGFGLIQPHKAEALLAQMVQLTQAKPEAITVPVEERVRIHVPNIDPQTPDENGNYVYEITMPPGIALKTTLDIEFATAHGEVAVVSPGGTRLPLAMSALNSATDHFSMSTMHGWAGEQLEGVWRIESKTPLKKLQMNQHHFMAQDIVAGLDVEGLLKAPRPSLAAAKPLLELVQEHASSWRGHNVLFSGMTVGSAPPQVQVYDDMVQQLKTLPSAFDTHARIYTKLPYAINGRSEGGRLETAAHKEEAPIQDRVHHYLDAAAAYQRDGERLQQAVMLSCAAGQLLRYIPPYNDNDAIPAQEAASLLDQAMEIHKADGRLDLAYLDCCTAYAAQGVIERHFETLRDQRRADAAANAMRGLRNEAGSLWEQYFGGADRDAHRVEEGTMGFSSSERIGTDNISQHLVIVARDPVTFKTGLVHLDGLVKPDGRVDYRMLDKTLSQFFRNFPPNRLEVRLIGAMHTNSRRSMTSLTGVMTYLATKNINVISADVLDGPSGPAAFVVDPQSFTISEKVPMKPTVNAAIGDAVILIGEPTKPLPIQFDFTKSSERAPILLNKDVLHHIRSNHLLTMNEAALEKHFGKMSDRPLVVEHMLALLEAYQREWTLLNTTLDDVLRTRGVDRDNAARAHKALEQQSFYVGEHAFEANQFLHAWIRDSLLVGGQIQHAAEKGPHAGLQTTSGFVAAQAVQATRAAAFGK